MIELICVQRFNQNGIGASFKLTGYGLLPSFTLTGEGAVAATVKIQVTEGFTGVASETWTDLDDSQIILQGTDRVEAHFDARIAGGSAIQNFGRVVVSGLAGSVKVSIASPASRCRC